MIQRIQTLWLLLAAGGALSSLKLPFYTGNNADKLFVSINGMSSFLLLLASIAVAVLALVAIFLFKNRSKQALVVLAGMVFQLGVLALYLFKIKTVTEGAMALSSSISFLIPVLFLLAWNGIRNDERLVKSMDRLR